MFKYVSTAAIAALVASTALTSAYAKTPVAKVTGGQFVGVTQYTGLVDPEGICASQAGLAVGQLTTSVATVTGLGSPFTETIANSNPSPTAEYGVGWINCSFAPLPAATAFTLQSNGTYTSSPTTAQTTSCLASNGTPYTLTSGNDSLDGETQTLLITVLPVNGTGKDYGFKITSTNSALAIGGNTICFLSTDSLYLNASK